MAMTLGKGAAVAITDADISGLAVSLKCHPADLEAIAEVESNGFGWFADGRMKILFEKHWFYKLIPEAKRDNAVKAGLARKTWVSPKQGGYKDQPDADSRYALLDRAIRVAEEAAFMSISMGKFQIMGFNHKLCGHQSAKQMFEAFCESEVFQLSAFAGFLNNKGLVPALRSRDFAKIEEVYNGGGLGGAYADKMRKASDKLRAGKWANWTPAAAAPKPAPAPTPDAPPQKYDAPSVPARSEGQALAVVVIALIVAITAWFSGAWGWLTNLVGF